MRKSLLIVDGDGTISKVNNPFFEMAKVLSCYTYIKQYADQYLAGVISYQELVSKQNPVFKEAGRKYAIGHDYQKLDPDLFAKLLHSIWGNSLVSNSMKAFLERVRRIGYELAMVSSGWDVIIAQVAQEAGISYWRANRVLFENGEFSGIIIQVEADKIKEFIAAVATFDVDYENVAYLGDNEFDIKAMKFIHERGGECLLRNTDRKGVIRLFPSYVRHFSSLRVMGDYLESKAKKVETS